MITRLLTTLLATHRELKARPAMAGIQGARSLATGGGLALKTSGVTSGNGVGAIVAIAQPQHRKLPRATAEPATARLSSAASACRPRHEPFEAVRAVHARRGVDQPPLGARDAPSGRHGSDGALAARPRGPRQRSRERRRHGSTGPGRRRKALSAARRGLDGASFAATHLRSRAIDAGKPSAQRMSAQAEIGARATRSRPRCTCQP